MTDTLYIPVGPNIMAGSLSFMRDYASSAEAMFTKLNYLPSLHNQFQYLVIDVVKSCQTLRDTALTAKMTLEKNLKALASLEDELTNAQRAEKDILAEHTALPANVKRNMREWTDQLSNQLSSIKSPLKPGLTQRYLEESAKDQVDAETALTLLNEKKVELQKQRQTLTDAIDAFSRSSTADNNKGTPLTQQSLTQLGMASPEIAVIMLAVEQMKETIGKIGEGIRFTDMVKQRDMLVNEIKDQSTPIALKEKQIVALKGQIEFINILQTLDNQLKIYTNDYQHVIDNFRVFTAQTDADFQVNTQQFITFLTPLSNPW